MIHNSMPSLGFGLGLRSQHYQYVCEHLPAVDWFEIVSENFFFAGGYPLYVLDKVCAHYPVVMHGVALSIGGSEPLNMDYLQRLKRLANRIHPAWISDHLCWTGVNGYNSHDLLPLPYTQELVQHVSQRIQQVQDYLGAQILLENISSYICFKQSEMTEWEFLTAIAEQSDCLILLDINNIFVNGYNHQFDPISYIKAIPQERVQQFHLAGHARQANYMVDTHDHSIITDVWDLYSKACQRFGAVSTLIERDYHVPTFAKLIAELKTARDIAQRSIKMASGSL